MVMIDRSNVNAADSYDIAAAHGVTHAYFKMSEGMDFIDSTYTARVAAADAAHIKVGPYHFGRAENNAVAEARHAVGLIGPKKDMRLCLDWERSQAGTVPSADWVAAFLAECKKQLGYWPVLYGSTSLVGPARSATQMLAHPLRTRKIRSAPWWRAEYGPNDGKVHALVGGDQGASAHQYTSVASIAGVAGHTDASLIMKESDLLVPAIRPRWKVTVNGTVVAHTRHPKRWERIHRRRFRKAHKHVHFDQVD